MGNEFNIFWKKKIKLISWFKKPKKILTKKNGKYVWFNDGKSNVAFNCLQKNSDETILKQQFIEHIFDLYWLSQENKNKKTTKINLNNKKTVF